MRTGLSVAEAQRTVLGLTPTLGAESVSTRDALGRVLVEEIRSSRLLPPADCSAMDGYAVRRADLVGASLQAPRELTVAFEVAAGHQADRAMGAGEVARIFTGAPLPAGADAVVRQEDAEREGDRVRITVEPEEREHVRDAGEDLKVGDLLLRAGDRIRPAEIGLLASLGRTVVSVHQRPRVAILSSGDELVEPDGDISGGRIVSSNSYSLAAQCLELGADPVYLGISRDRPEDLERHMRAALGADCIVSSAGVSVGDRDYVRPVLEKLGCRMEFWGVLMKPGYPLAFGRFEWESGPLVFGLPGNPVSAMVSFEQFARPALRKMTGHRALFRPTVQARISEPLSKKAGRTHFVRVILERRGEQLWASSTGNQSSGVLSSMSRARGLMVFPREAVALAQGETVTVQVLDDEFFARETPGLPD
jgi:molybdopterin molybdotransferase